MGALDRRDVVQMDLDDPMARFREAFAIPNDIIYLDGNSLGVLPKATIERMATVISGEWGDGLIRSWTDHDWISMQRRTGDKIAGLIGARPGEVIVADSVSVNIFKLLCAALNLNPERRVILSETGNFPTDVYIIQGLERFLGGRVEARLLSYETVVDAISEDVAVLLMTQVHYKTGRIRNMAEITRRAHEKGVIVIWDLSHSTGSIEVDLNGAKADFAVGCGYKYLNGGPGAPGFLFAAERHIERCEPVLTGWLGHKDPFDFNDIYRPATGIERFLVGSPPILSIAALEAGVDLMLSADMRSCRQKAMALGHLFIRLVEERCGSWDFELACPQDAGERGSQVSFRHAEGYPIMQALIARGVIGDFRAPDLLRFGLAPLYVRYADIFDAVSILAEIMSSGEWKKPEYHRRKTVT